LTTVPLVRRKDALLTMQDDRNCSQEINKQTLARLSWVDALRSTSEFSPLKIMPHGQAPTLHEFDRPWEQPTLSHQKIEALQEQRQYLERTIKELTLRTLTDDLTGLRNRRRFREDLESAWSYAVRHNLLLSAIALDLDDFKSYNETFGESAGDQLLRDLAGYLASGLRAYDVLAHLGGGQFALLLPSTDRTDVRSIAERLRKGMEDHDSPLRPITASFGVATLESPAISSLRLVDQSFQALQQAKQQGRNRVTHFVDL
jgi:diguanylate cyclase (GGDEF)-like protein